jgi:hypothetical protein
MQSVNTEMQLGDSLDELGKLSKELSDRIPAITKVLIELARRKA